jgi:hypothetical protein
MDCQTQYVSQFLSYAATNNMGWTAWAWYPASCNFPSLISDWNGNPTEVGAIVRAAM